MENPKESIKSPEAGAEKKYYIITMTPNDPDSFPIDQWIQEFSSEADANAEVDKLNSGSGSERATYSLHGSGRMTKEEAIKKLGELQG